MFSGDTLNSFSLRSRTMKDALSHYFLKYFTGNSSHYNRSREINEIYANWKRRNKTIFIQREHKCLNRKSRGH